MEEYRPVDLGTDYHQQHLKWRKLNRRDNTMAGVARYSTFRNLLYHAGAVSSAYWLASLWHSNLALRCMRTSSEAVLMRATLHLRTTGASAVQQARSIVFMATILVFLISSFIFIPTTRERHDYPPLR